MNLFKLNFVINGLLLVLLSSQTARSHEIFQDILKEKYTLKSFSCKTCHPNGDDRKIRTPFADLYYEAMKDGGWTKKFEDASAKGEEAVTEFEQVIGEAFKKSLDQVGQSTLTVDQLFASALLAGVRIDEKKLKAKQQSKNQSNTQTHAPAGGNGNEVPELPSELPQSPVSSALPFRDEDV